MSYMFPKCGNARRGLVGLVIALFVVVIALFAANVREQLKALSVASSDNVHWALSQSEVEVISLQNAILEATTSGEPNLSVVRRQFDVFYSRIALIKESRVYTEIRKDADVAGAIGDLDRFLDRWAPVIDGPDAILATELQAFLEDVKKARMNSRTIALRGISVFSNLRDEQRSGIHSTLRDIAQVTAALVVVLLVLLLALTRTVRLVSRRERESRETRDRMETIISTSLDAIIVADTDGRIVEYNGAAERVFGYRQDQAIGADMSELIIPERYRKMHREGMARYRQTGEKRVIGKGSVQLDATRSDGTIFPIDLSLAAAQSPDGEIFVGFIRDISDRVRAESELLEARDKAIAGEKSKAQLLAVMSHEMRTPLNGMLGTLELIDLEKLDPQQTRYLRIIRNSGNQLRSHVNDVLDISRLDAGKMAMNPQKFDLVLLLEEVIESQMSRARENGNTIRLTPPNPILHEVHSDPVRLRQIILNLVGNAIKFTRNGKIIIEADCSGELDEVEIRVIDNGVGIAEEDLDRIFGDFITVDASYGRSNSGTGLGLGISRRLATALGGELGAESELGDGSIFYLRLPMNASDEKANDPQSAPEEEADVSDRLPPLDILMVEDNSVNRLVAREMLERDGHRVIEAHDGEQGVKLASEMVFDVILMDISMPGMDGVQTARAIREGAGASANVPIVAATAHALPDEIRVFCSAGMSQVLVKPLSQRSLRKALSAAIHELAAEDPEGDEDEAEQPIIDIERITQLNEDLPAEHLLRAMSVFFREMNAFAASVGDMARSAERKPLRDEAHRMAGSASVFGALQLTDQLRDMQRACEADNGDLISALAAAIPPCWEATSQEIRRSPIATIGDFELTE